MKIIRTLTLRTLCAVLVAAGIASLPKSLSCANIARAEPPSAGRRIVSLAPSLTEILFELGLDGEIVGVTVYCDYPAAASAKEKVGDVLNPAVETIVMLRPDVVFSLVDGKTARVLRNAGLRVVVFDPQNVQELKKTISEIGDITGRRAEASALTAEIDSIVSSEKKKATARSEERPGVYVETHWPPPWSCSDTSFIGEVLGIMGCRNVFAGTTAKKYFPVSHESVVRANPDVILVLSGDDNIARRAGYGRIKAVRQSRIILWHDRGSLVRATPRMIRTIPVLREKIFGDEK